jgi:hypothetical protein
MQQIPKPISLAQYDQQSDLGSADFSSWVYLIDMCRISKRLVLLYQDSFEDKNLRLFEQADFLISEWSLKLPQWKMDLVDSGGMADMVLFHAIALAQQSVCLPVQS